MERRCPSCDQLLLADEAVCWQCGERLPQLDQTSSAEPAGERQELARPSSHRQSSALGIYAAWTAVLVIAALLTTILLGMQPRVQAAGVPLPGGWTVVVDRQRSITLYLPQAWDLLDAADDDESQHLQQLLEGAAEYRRALEPLAGFVEDEEVLLLAQGSTASQGSGSGAFLVIMQSELLNRLTLAEATGLAQESDRMDGTGGEALVTDARRVTNFDKSHVALTVQLPAADGEELVCYQQFTTGERRALLLALCSAPGRLAPDAIETVLSSTQRLAP